MTPAKNGMRVIDHQPLAHRGSEALIERRPNLLLGHPRETSNEIGPHLVKGDPEAGKPQLNATVARAMDTSLKSAPRMDITALDLTAYLLEREILQEIPRRKVVRPKRNHPQQRL